MRLNKVQTYAAVEMQDHMILVLCHAVKRDNSMILLYLMY